MKTKASWDLDLHKKSFLKISRSIRSYNKSKVKRVKTGGEKQSHEFYFVRLYVLSSHFTAVGWLLASSLSL